MFIARKHTCRLDCGVLIEGSLANLSVAIPSKRIFELEDAAFASNERTRAEGEPWSNDLPMSERTRNLGIIA